MHSNVEFRKPYYFLLPAYVMKCEGSLHWLKTCEKRIHLIHTIWLYTLSYFMYELNFKVDKFPHFIFEKKHFFYSFGLTVLRRLQKRITIKTTRMQEKITKTRQPKTIPITIRTSMQVFESENTIRFQNVLSCTCMKHRARF